MEEPAMKCFHCGIPSSSNTPLLRCSGCDVAWYCGPQHQEYDWKKHKPFCRAILAEKKKGVPASSSSSSLVSNHSTSSFMMELPRRKSGEASGVELSTAPSCVLQETPIDSDLAVASLNSARLMGEPQPAKKARIETRPLPEASKEANLSEKKKHKAPEPTSNVPIPKKNHVLNRPYGVTVAQHLQSCLATCPNMPRYEAFCLRVQEIAAHLLSALNNYGWGAVDNFLGDTHADAILGEVKTLYQTSTFATGQLMKGTKKGAMIGGGQSNVNIRSDFMYWFDNTKKEAEDCVNLNFCLSMLDSVLVQVGAGLKGCRVKGRSRAMVAVYPGNGSRYVKHVDNPAEDGRVLTTIYYLNKNWKRDDGGSLRLYPISAEDSVDIQPVFDRLFVFWSDRRNPHEVLPVYSNRFAVTVWYFDEGEKKRALERAAERQARKRAKSRVAEQEAHTSSSHII